MHLPPSTCAVDTTASGSPLTSQQAEELARSVMWRSKYQQPRFWQTLWAKGFYPKRLSGPTCEPSTLSRGVESWISSLLATRANRSQSPESVAAKAIRATCGPKWLESWGNASQLLASSRTSQGTFSWDLIESPKTWNDWVTALRQECLRRRKLARVTRENGSSSWPTAKMSDGEHGGPSQRAHGDLTLPSASAQWLTPHGFANTDASGHEAGAAGEFGKQVKEWVTPASADSVGSHGGGQGRSLRTDIAESWPTARANELAGRGHARRKPGTGGAMLSETAENCSLQAQSTLDGDELSSSGPTSRPQLNPRFVEWLMGVPRGWTSLECSATELSRYRALMRSALCRLCSDSERWSEAA